MTSALTPFLWGALFMACWVAGLFFVRYFRRSHERLFLFFALGFWTLGLNWLALALAVTTDESRHYIYVLRLLAFGFIIVGIVDKNRRA